ncbi:OTU-like cysteine protease [Klebsormidium nitens]|uniref:Ubiquitin thioesterase OTU n=1 Tax=Klebsormidium nitens TaxID=105231 RepID=A0A1Y1HSS0_KLENI|nr:OTU-like cysteine protease [Klebsormidium nitens]|eukprot:GAQ81675.1 OTU-like cysteine protease [Klebsormidium nitens]
MEQEKIVRRIIAADNSCLFNAVGYVMDHDLGKSQELRRVIANKVRSDPEQYDEAVLEKSNEDYCRWILDRQKWGGAIELSVLADHYGREIAAYDIQTKRCDIYGQGEGYKERAMLIYDGLHYDALALEMFPGAPKDFDVTIFTVDETGGVGYVTQLAEKLVDEQHRAKKFTDTQNFTLRCQSCQQGLKGQKEAVEHARSTGHTNFAEYS